MTLTWQYDNQFSSISIYVIQSQYHNHSIYHVSNSPNPATDYSTMGTETFPSVEPNGSLLLAWQVRARPVLVVGGGEVAAGRILGLLNASAHITIICPWAGCNAEVQHRILTHPLTIRHIDAEWDEYYLLQPPPCLPRGYSLVLTATDSPAVSSSIYTLCAALRIPANIADVPPECDFYFGSVHRDGPLQIMVSTNGNGPRLAAAVRKSIAANLPPGIGAAIVKVGRLRKKLRKVAPDIAQGKKRMAWMSRVCDKWSLEDLVAMSEEDMEELLTFYGPNQVPKFKDISAAKEPVDATFDGSFGFTVGC